MRLDHLSFAVGPDGLSGTTARLTEQLGAAFVDGGIHPRFGTRNMVLPLEDGHYVEVVEALDHPASDKVPFGQVVRARSEAGGGWLGWVVRVDDIRPVEHRIGRHSVPGNRRLPDGTDLRWHQIGVKGLQADPQLPFVVQWEVDHELHPSNVAHPQVRLSALEIAGSSERVEEWLGERVLDAFDGIEVDWVAPNGLPGVVAARFETPLGPVRI